MVKELTEKSKKMSNSRLHKNLFKAIVKDDESFDANINQITEKFKESDIDFFKSLLQECHNCLENIKYSCDKKLRA